MRRFLIGALVVGLIAVIALWFAFKDRYARATMVASLFTGAEQYQNFHRLHELFPVGELAPADQPFEFGAGERITLPPAFAYSGQPIDTAAFLAETDTAALLVVKNGDVVFEEYWLTGGRDVTWLSMSVAKSFVSALVGIAVAEGQIESIEDPITKYASSLSGSAYDSVRIKDILQMSSGARWNEDYGDPDSDINRFGRIFALGGSLNEFAATLTSEREPGTFNKYNSTDTQVLGMLLVEATGRTVTDYMTEKLWRPMGAESVGYWLLDSEGMEMVFGGMNATARDYAKLGELVRRGGRLNGRQIVPEDWVRASVTPDAPHLQPGDNPASDYDMGYGYQWWVPQGDEGEFSAVGVYNQFVFVNPARGLVIVKLSANSDYATSQDGSSDREFDTLELFRAIADVAAPL